MRVQNPLVTIGLILALAGCAQKITTTVPFNTDQAQVIRVEGTNIIKGQALIRQAGGGVVTCAATQVSLVPVTDYAKQRIGQLYGPGPSGYRDALNPAEADETSPDYLSYMRKQSCDAQGNFEFTKVADGAYYVIAVVTWTVEYLKQGGSLMQRVDIKGGETRQIILAPETKY